MVCKQYIMALQILLNPLQPVFAPGLDMAVFLLPAKTHDETDQTLLVLPLSRRHYQPLFSANFSEMKHRHLLKFVPFIGICGSNLTICVPFVCISAHKYRSSLFLSCGCPLRSCIHPCPCRINLWVQVICQLIQFQPSVNHLRSLVESDRTLILPLGEKHIALIFKVDCVLLIIRLLLVLQFDRCGLLLLLFLLLCRCYFFLLLLSLRFLLRCFF